MTSTGPAGAPDRDPMTISPGVTASITPYTPEPGGAPGMVVATHAGPTSPMAKPARSSIVLVVGSGVEGDRHYGATTRHAEASEEPARPNHRQVHLVADEVLDGLRANGFDVAPGALGENLTTRGVDLLALPLGTLLHVGPTVVELTVLRHPGPPSAPVDGPANRLDADGVPVGKVGVFGIVVRGGRVRPGDRIVVRPSAGPHRELPTA